MADRGFESWGSGSGRGGWERAAEVEGRMIGKS